MRTTYIDNNGFERYEDNNKIKQDGNHFYTEQMFSGEMKTWTKKNKRKNCNNYKYDYENKILIRQEKYND